MLCQKRFSKAVLKSGFPKRPKCFLLENFSRKKENITFYERNIIEYYVNIYNNHIIITKIKRGFSEVLGSADCAGREKFSKMAILFSFGKQNAVFGKPHERKPRKLFGRKSPAMSQNMIE